MPGSQVSVMSRATSANARNGRGSSAHRSAVAPAIAPRPSQSATASASWLGRQGFS